MFKYKCMLVVKLFEISGQEDWALHSCYINSCDCGWFVSLYFTRYTDLVDRQIKGIAPCHCIPPSGITQNQLVAHGLAAASLHNHASIAANQYNCLCYQYRWIMPVFFIHFHSKHMILWWHTNMLLSHYTHATIAACSLWVHMNHRILWWNMQEHKDVSTWFTPKMCIPDLLCTCVHPEMWTVCAIKELGKQYTHNVHNEKLQKFFFNRNMS